MLSNIRLNIRETLIITALLVISFTVRFLYLDYPKEFIYDEIFYITNPYSVYSGDIIHIGNPPLGILLISLGKLLLKPEFLGSRLFSCICGTSCILLVFLIAVKLCGNFKTALTAALLFCLDPLCFVFSRIAMLDMFFVFFMLATLFFTFEKKYFFAGIFMGLAISAKWTMLFILPFLLLLIIFNSLYAKEKYKYFLISFISYIIIPAAIYYLVFGICLKSMELNLFLKANMQIINILKSIPKNLSYTSPWWTWFIIPQYIPAFSFTDPATGQIKKLVAFTENPFFLWFGLISIAGITFCSFREKKYIYLSLTICFFLFLLPYAFLNRPSLFYYILPCLPFLHISLAVFLSEEFKTNKFIMLMVILQAVFAFVYLYPSLTGMGI